MVQNAAVVAGVCRGVYFIFCAVDMPKDETRALEDRYAKAETPVVSNNSAHRATPDVPMLRDGKLTADDQLVVLHDSELTRASNASTPTRMAVIPARAA